MPLPLNSDAFSITLFCIGSFDKQFTIVVMHKEPDLIIPAIISIVCMQQCSSIAQLSSYSNDKGLKVSQSHDTGVLYLIYLVYSL